jgi:trehalose 6-phosphate phosphatase
MKPILDPLHRPILQEFLRPSTLVAFDYDGTLAPIVDDPDEAEMRLETRELLRLIAKRHSVAVITGRSRIGAMRFLDGIPLVEVVGNHGAEGREAMPNQIIERVAEWRSKLEPRLNEMEGVVLEDKIFSLSIHYRKSPERGITLKIMSAVEDLRGARKVGGKSVVNIIPREAPNKGTSLQGLCERFRACRSIFVGDDDTDEDVFKMVGAGSVLGIRVGASNDTAANYYIDDQTDIDPLLKAMVEPFGIVS